MDERVNIKFYYNKNKFKNYNQVSKKTLIWKFT